MLQGRSHGPIGKIFCRATKVISKRALPMAFFDLFNISEGFWKKVSFFSLGKKNIEG